MDTPDLRSIIVDGSDDDFRTLRELLTQIGFVHIDHVSNTEDAIDRIEKAIFRREPYQALFVDFSILKTTDLALLKRCKGTPNLRRMPFIGVTHQYEREMVIRVVHAGIDDIFLKSFSIEEIARRMSRILKDKSINAK